MSQVLGIDIGGSGMKAAIVDCDSGETLTDRFRIKTPQPAKPQPMIDVARELVSHFEWEGPVGVGFPGVVQGGFIRTAANLDKDWVGVDADRLLTEAASCDVEVVNDADAAGVAEVQFGAGEGVSGVVVLLTIGTGIGSAVFTDGKLVRNTEFGHLMIDGKAAEERASSRIKKEKDLSEKEWTGRLSTVLQEVEALVWPDLFILGGGISKSFDEWGPMLKGVRTKVVPAEMRNEAGIIGAALAHQRR